MVLSGEVVGCKGWCEVNTFKGCKPIGLYYTDGHGCVYNSEMNRYHGRLVRDCGGYRYIDSGVYLLSLAALGAIVVWLKILNGEVR